MKPLDDYALNELLPEKVLRDGEKIRIYTRNVSETLSVLSQISRENEFKINEINTLKPSLEDAFIRLTGLSSEQMRVDKEGRR